MRCPATRARHRSTSRSLAGCLQRDAAGAYEISIFAPAKSGGVPGGGEGCETSDGETFAIPEDSRHPAERERTAQLYEIPCLALVYQPDVIISAGCNINNRGES